MTDTEEVLDIKDYPSYIKPPQQGIRARLFFALLLLAVIGFIIFEVVGMFHKNTPMPAEEYPFVTNDALYTVTVTNSEASTLSVYIFDDVKYIEYYRQYVDRERGTGTVSFIIKGSDLKAIIREVKHQIDTASYSATKVNLSVVEQTLEKYVQGLKP